MRPAPTRRPYEYARPNAGIATLVTLPVAVIQATRDNYLPAPRARELPGPHAPLRRLCAVDAGNHRFSGGEAARDEALLDALRWVIGGRIRPVAGGAKP